MQSFTIVGPGRIGGALAVALGRLGHRIDSVIGRHRKSGSNIARHISPRPSIQTLQEAGYIRSDVVLITTPDANIGDTAKVLAGLFTSKKQIVLHTSGSLSSSILQPLAELGLSTGSIHPLISVSSPVEGAEKFASAYFCVEGDARAVRMARRLARDLGGRSFSINTQSKPLYHLSAVLAAGHLTALADVAFSLMAQTGLSRRQAKRILLPLIVSTVANLQSKDVSDALTGPIARGDVSVVERHLVALSAAASKNESDIYLDLALRSIDIVESGDTTKDLRRMRKLILLAKQKTK